MKPIIDTKFDSIDATLADIPNATTELSRQLSYLRNDGTFHIIGDSISAGYGLAYSQQYATKLLNLLNSLFQPVNDSEIITNMWDEPTLTKGGGYDGSAGNIGCCSQTVILKPNNTIAFVTSAEYIDVIFHKQTTAGKLEFYNGATLIKTIDCSGVEDINATSFASTPINGLNKNITIKCINANVEILGVIRVTARDQRGNPYKFRHAVSGENTTFFTNISRLSAIKKVDNFCSPTQKTYLIGVGTNDIYNPSKANTPSQYSINLETIIVELLNQNVKVNIILTAPPIPTNTWSPVSNLHSEYIKVLYVLASKYNCTVIDYTNVDFISANSYQDGLHPNSNGTDMMLDVIKRTLANIGVKKTSISPFARLLSNTQSIVTGSFVSVAFSTEANDTDNIFDISLPTRLTCNTSGFYNIFASVDFASNSTGVRIVTFKLNGSYIGQNYQNAINGLDHFMSTNTCIYLNVGDYIEVQVYQTSGSALNLLSNSQAGMVKLDK